MMLKTLMTSLALTAALGAALPAYAQVTDQTDQSEEDWRKSQKKKGSSDIYRDPNRRSTGSGAPIVDYEPVSPVDTIPSESRRHLMKERAKAIANSDDGDISDAEYVPSEDAKSDEQLMRDEQEAWEVLTTDLQGSGGEATSEGGPNKVAVTGENGATPTRGSRGGSTRTLQEIMDAIKNGQAGGSGTAGASGSSGSDQADPNSDQAGQGEQVADAQSAAGSQGQSDGEAQSGAAIAGQSQGDGSSDSDSDSQGSSDNDGDASGNGDDRADEGAAAAWPAETRAEEPLSPLERIRRSREDRPAEGTQRSASDYLGTGSDE